MHSEDLVWKTTPVEKLWVLDKLLLSRTLGYECGPTGIDVDKPGTYIVRPCVNALGLGLGAEKVYLNGSTNHLPYGYFWCEWFDGRHFSVDYEYGKQKLCVEGFKSANTFTHWDRWVKVAKQIVLPNELAQFKEEPILNVEYIDGKAIEVHLRENEDFADGISEFIPVWQGQDTDPPSGFTYRHYPDVHGRIGAFVR